VRTFHPPAGVFDGIIGGPPCQAHSQFAYLVRAVGKRTAVDLIPEFARCIREASPKWFLMENSPHAPGPDVDYRIQSFVLDNRWLGEKQSRRRRFFFGMRDAHVPDLRQYIQPAALEHPDWHRTVLASGGMRPGTETRRGRMQGKNYGYTSQRTVRLALELQGLPENFLDHAPFTIEGKQRVIGNGVPLPLGRAVAQAIRAAIGLTAENPAHDANQNHQ